MKKDIQIMLKATVRVLTVWRRILVFGILLLALVLLNYQEQFNYPEADINRAFTEIILAIIADVCIFHIVCDWGILDGKRWWRILGYGIGVVIGGIVFAVVRESIFSLTIDGVLKGWVFFAGTSIVLHVLQHIVGREVQK